MTQTVSKTKANPALSGFSISTETDQTVLKSPKDEETLYILTDKKLLRHIRKSLKEAREGKIEPLKNILE